MADPGRPLRAARRALAALERPWRSLAGQPARRPSRPRSRPLSRLLVGLGIRHVGPTGARALARAFGDLPPLRAAPTGRWRRSTGIGPVIAASVVEFLAGAGQRRACSTGWPPPGSTCEPRADGARGRPPPGPGRATLSGKSVVVTGTVPGYTREEAEAAILAGVASRRGRCPSGPSLCVVGEAPGAAKLSKAESLGDPDCGGRARSPSCWRPATADPGAVGAAVRRLAPGPPWAPEGR